MPKSFKSDLHVILREICCRITVLYSIVYDLSVWTDIQDINDGLEVEKLQNGDLKERALQV